MNTPLLTPQDAFNAMLAGKHVLCRLAGDMLDFRDLNEFPATIFAKPDYEFCIKIEMVEIAGIEFTKPLTLEDVEREQDIFIVGTTGSIHHYRYQQCTALDTAINCGFAQRDEVNAKLQIQGLAALFGRQAPEDILVVDVGTQYEKPKTTRKAKSKPTAVVADDLSSVVDRLKSDINKATTLEEMLVIDKELSSLHQKLDSESLGTITTAFVSKKSQLREKDNVDVAFTGTTAVEDNLVTFQPSPNKEASLVAQMKSAESKHELYALLPELRSLHGEAGHRVMTVYEAEEKRFELFEDLMQRAANAQTPTEANALIKYTSTWTEEQRKPLMTAIHKRLLELAPVSEEPAPSILRDIENAPDLTALDALEIDVSARSPEIQKTLMAEITKRRVFLETQGVV